MRTWRPRTRLGKFRERITIERATVDISTGQPDRTWSTHMSSVPASYDPATGSETTRGRQVEANVKAVFTMHYTDGITPEDRVIYDGWTWGIVAMMPVEGGQRYMELHCTGVATARVVVPTAPEGQSLLLATDGEYILDTSGDYVTADAT